MPIGELIWQVKSRASEYDVDAIKAVRAWVETSSPRESDRSFPHVPITRGAFAKEQEARLMWYDEQFEVLGAKYGVEELLKFVLLSVLEDISYTSKDGQFLRWDSRSGKMQALYRKRAAQGKRPVKVFHKRSILDVKTAVLKALDLIISDVLQSSAPPSFVAEQNLQIGSVLDTLPSHRAALYDAAITSPPYCNRYDYTRTYALELAYLGVSANELLALRQDLLTCTVENRPKINRLQRAYSRRNRQSEFDTVMRTLEDNAELEEILNALQVRNRRREVNNRGVISMVKGYFTELAFVTLELYRTCKSGGSVAIVNDNVRYSGEIIPVDLMMTNIAASFGFKPDKIYVLPQRKGNSSQQMGKFGREALRKSILIWKK